MRSFQFPEPAYQTFPMAEPRRELPPDPLIGIWGRLELEATVLRPTHIGSGAWALVGGGRQLAAATVTQPPLRSDQWPTPCIPGSSLKGALRVVAEVLSPSCDPLSPPNCRADQLCPACTVFGLAGRRGLVSPGELRLAGEPPTTTLRVAQRYSHQGTPRRGRRLYRLKPEVATAEAFEVLEVLPPGSVLFGELGLQGVPDWGAGLVTIVLGVGPLGLPLLRAGGAKNRGQGALAIRVTNGWWGVGPQSGLCSATARSAVNDAVFGVWQQAATERFPQLANLREQVAELYDLGQQ